MRATALTRRECLSLLGASGALALAGCSGDETDPDQQEATPTERQDPTPTETAVQTGGIVVTARGLVATVDADGGAESVDEAAVRAAVTEAMSAVPERDVHVNETAGVVEVRADGDPAALVAGLDAAGYDVAAEDVRRGVTESTWDELVAVIEARLSAAGYEEASVTRAATSTDEGALVEVSAADPDAVADLLADRGRVELVASYPAAGDGETEQREAVLATQGDFARIGPVQRRGGQPPSVAVTLTEAAATDLRDALVENGFTDEGVGNCRWQDDRDDPGYCIYTVVDGEVTYAAGLSPGLADVFRNGEFVQDPRFVMQTEDQETAEALRRNLEAGALPAPLSVERTD